MAKIKDIPAVLSYPISEKLRGGHYRLLTNRRPIEYPSNDQQVNAGVDGRRIGRGIGFQTPYFSVLPEGSDVRMFWVGKEADETQSRESLRQLLRAEHAKGHLNVAFLVGGEHMHPKTTGTTRDAEENELTKYGGYDKARDIVGEEILNLAEEQHLPIVAICRGSQMMVNYYSHHLAVPGDHNQEEHTYIKTDGDPILRQHAVVNMLPEEVRARLSMQPPVVNDVNSAHAQGYRLCDISQEAMTQLAENGWHPWLLAHVPGVAQEEQVVEAWIRVNGNKITGVATQFHPERQQDDDGAKVREFMKAVVLANKRNPSRRTAGRLNNS